MIILVLDSAFEPTVSIIKNKKTILTNVSENTNHSDNFMLLIDNSLKQADLSIEDIETIMVNVGPGSFTGLRVGVSIAKGLGFGDDKRILTFTSFDYLANKKEMLIPAFSNFVYKSDNNGQMSCEDINALDKNTKYVTINKVLFEKLKSLSFNISCAEKLSYLKILENIDKKYLNINELEPLYLRKSQAELEREKLKVKK